MIKTGSRLADQSLYIQFPEVAIDFKCQGFHLALS